MVTKLSSDKKLIVEEQLAGACHWSLYISRGTVLRLIDELGGANVGMLFFNPLNLLERYNAPDTLKCQHTFKLSKGHCLYSDMGRIFCSIIEDTVGWHETVCGNTNKKIVKNKWGEKTYQEHKNDWHQNGYDSFLVELAKYGLGKKDMAANLNFFSKVEVDNRGDLHFVAQNSKPGDFIDLRFEMDTLVVMHTCPHPLNPDKNFPRRPIIYQISKADELKSDDFCMNFREENMRGFENNRVFNASVRQQND